MIIVKIYLGLSLVLWAVWGQFMFGQFLDLAYISQDLQAPSNVVGANYRVLICCMCPFKVVPSVYFSFFCQVVSSVSNFCPNTRGVVVVTFFQARLFSSALGREEHCKQIYWHLLTVIQPHWVCPHSQHVCFPSLHCSDSRLLCWELSDGGPGFACTSQV